jgi:hypothetical protein
MSVYSGPEIANDGLVLYLDAANPKSYPGSGTTWTNIGNSVTNGTLVNGPVFDLGNPYSLSFDGNNDHVTISDEAQLYWTPGGTIGNSNLTIDLWIKSSDTNGRLYTKPWNGSGQYNIWILPDSFYLFAGTVSNSISFGRNLSNNTWTNIVCWANSTQMGYYLNSSQHTGSKNHGITGTVPSSGQSNIPTGLMTLYPYGSGWAGNTGFSIEGFLSSVKVYNCVLTEQEVKQNFNATKSRYGL